MLDWLRRTLGPVTTADASVQLRETRFGVPRQIDPGQAGLVSASVTLTAATQLRSSMLASLPVEVATSGVAGGVMGNVAIRQLLYQVAYDVYLRGVTYLVIDGEGLLTTFRQLGPDRVQPQVVDYTTTSYLVDGQLYPTDQVVELKSYDGLGAAKRLEDVVKLEVSLLQGTAAAAVDTARPRYVLQVEDESVAVVTPEDLHQLAQSIGRQFALNADTRVFTTPPGVRLVALESRADEEYEVIMADVLAKISIDSGIPAPLLGSTDAATYNNVENYRLWTYSSTLIPEAQQIAMTVNEKLGSYLGTDSVLEFDFEAIQALAVQDERRAQVARTYGETAAQMVSSLIWTPEQAATWIQEKLDELGTSVQ